MDHRQIAGCAALAILVMSPTAPAGAAKPSQLEREVRAAREETLPHGLFQTGSGFFVSDGVLVLTGAHVVAGCRTFKVRDVANHEQKAALLFWDGVHDIAVLRPDKRGPGGLSLWAGDGAAGDGPGPSPGDDPLRVFQQHFEIAAKNGPTERTVRRLPREITMGSFNMIALDAALDAGMSGSPIVDAAGDAVGMVTARLEVNEDGPRTVTIGVEARDLARAVLWAGGQARSQNSEAAADAGSLTVRVRCQ